jgi:hypothetical protein
MVYGVASQGVECLAQRRPLAFEPSRILGKPASLGALR